MTTDYRPLILHVSHGSARGDVAQNGVAELSLHTSVEALADGLLAMYRTDATAAQVLGEVLARLAGVTEYNAVLGTDAERWNALILEQMDRAARAERERDEARARTIELLEAIDDGETQGESWVDFRIVDKIRALTTPTQGEKP